MNAPKHGFFSEIVQVPEDREAVVARNQALRPHIQSQQGCPGLLRIVNWLGIFNRPETRHACHGTATQPGRTCPDRRPGGVRCLSR